MKKETLVKHALESADGKHFLGTKKSPRNKWSSVSFDSSHDSFRFLFRDKDIFEKKRKEANRKEMLQKRERFCFEARKCTDRKCSTFLRTKSLWKRGASLPPTERLHLSFLRRKSCEGRHNKRAVLLEMDYETHRREYMYCGWLFILLLILR